MLIAVFKAMVVLLISCGLVACQLLTINSASSASKPTTPTVVNAPAPNAPTSALEQLYASTPPYWWQQLQGSNFQQLVTLALAHNYDLKTTLTKVEIAQAAYRKVRSNRLPTLYAKAGYSNEQTGYSDSIKSAGLPDKKGTQYGIDFSYDFDVFGVKRASRAAAAYEAQASQLSLQAAQNTLLQELLVQYVSYQTLSSKRQTMQLVLDAKQAVRALTAQKVQAGLASQTLLIQKSIDVINQQAVVDGLTQAVAQSKVQLAALVGVPSTQVPLVVEADFVSQAWFSQPLPAATPIDILSARQDIQMQDLRLKAEHARLLGAQRSRLPQTALSLVYGRQDISLSPFGNALTGFKPSLDPVSFITLALQFAFPLFDPSIKWAIQAQTLQERLALENYESTVANAFSQIDGLLLRQQDIATQYAQWQQLQQQQLLLKQHIGQLYQAGRVSKIETLESDMALLALTEMLYNQQEQQAVTKVRLITALGGKTQLPQFVPVPASESLSTIETPLAGAFGAINAGSSMPSHRRAQTHFFAVFNTPRCPT